MSFRGDALDEALNQLLAAEKEIKRLREEVKRLRSVGAQMANICFNLAQRKECAEWSKTMDELWRKWDAALTPKSTEPTACEQLDKLISEAGLTARIDMSQWPNSTESCGRCDGCGQIADTDDGAPWTFWEQLPPGSDIAVRMGLVKPIPCPDCAKKEAESHG